MEKLIPAEDDTMTLTFDDGVEMECAVVAVFPVGEKNYIALLPLEAQDKEEAEVYIYRIIADNEDDVQLENIESDEEWEIVADAYDEFMDNEEFEELFED